MHSEEIWASVQGNKEFLDISFFQLQDSIIRLGKDIYNFKNSSVANLPKKARDEHGIFIERKNKNE